MGVYTRRLVWAIITLWLAPVSLVFAADISAEMGALLSDVLKPYRAGGAVPPGTDPQAVEAALQILKKEKLLDLPRPPTRVTGVVESFGKALALGTRSQQFRGEIGVIYDALTRGDEQGAKDAIRNLYKKAGRTPPEGESLEKLYNDVRAAHGAEPKETERVEIMRPDYTITNTWARSAGKVKVDVTGQQGPDGKPFRTVFEGDVVARPDASGKGLELAAQPAPSPRTIGPAQAQALREKLNGRWTDQKGRTWAISGNGGSITLTETRENSHKVVYNGRYDLAKITAEHVVSDPLDTEDLPEPVAQQVAANFKTPYRIALDVSPSTDRMDGTVAAQYVTYDSTDYTVKRIHDWYDRPLTLSRPGTRVAQGGRWPQDGP
jgi:hypothetical protein